MNILFLDIDGVLNSKEWYEKNKPQILSESGMFWRSVAELDPEACARVNRLCDEEDLKIVISSTWRKLHAAFKIESMFAKKGLFAEVIGVTPDLKGNWRGNEVALFIKEHPELQIEKHVILDDDTDFDADQPFVRTSWDIGVQDDDIEMAKQVLNGRL